MLGNISLMTIVMMMYPVSPVDNLQSEPFEGIHLRSFDLRYGFLFHILSEESCGQWEWTRNLCNRAEVDELRNMLLVCQTITLQTGDDRFKVKSIKKGLILLLCFSIDMA